MTGHVPTRRRPVLSLITAARARNPLPSGTTAVGIGLLTNGVASYAFLVLTARALGPAEYAPLSVLWAMFFLVGPGVFLPVEQEVSRAVANRRARGLGSGPLILRAALLGGVLLGVLVVVGLAAAPVVVDRLFRGQGLLLVGLLIGLTGAFAGHLCRGTFSGLARFPRYGVFLGSDGLLRLLLAGVLVLVGVEVAGPYGVALGVAPLLALGVALLGRRGFLQPGPPAPWGELSGALGALLVASVMAQILVNAGPLTVELLATDAQAEEAGRFLAGLVIARIPLFLFQAVQAALLPRLSALAGAGRIGDFREGLRRLLLVVLLLCSAAVVAGFTAGPWVVRTLFGADFALGSRTVGLLAAASGAYIVAVALAQALIALGGHSRVAAGWSTGVTAFLVVVALGDDLFLRVELGYLAGAATAAAVMAGLLSVRLRRPAVPEGDDVVVALHDLPLEP